MTDGSSYIGSWRAGKRQGQGRCLYASGDQYEGDWEEDVRDGQGGCIYASGDKYKGDCISKLSNEFMVYDWY